MMMLSKKSHLVAKMVTFAVLHYYYLLLDIPKQIGNALLCFGGGIKTSILSMGSLKFDPSLHFAHKAGVL